MPNAMMIQKQLTILFLLLTVLLAPLNSFVHEATAETAGSLYTCHLADHGQSDSGSQPDQLPGGDCDHSCDCEGCCPDAAEPAQICGLNLNFSVLQHIPSSPYSFLPKVILAIFVPPQSSSLA